MTVPEWGGEVIVRALTAAEFDEYEASLQDGEDRNLDNARARLVVRCIVDENGERIFEDADSDLLGEKSMSAVGRLADVAARMNRRSSADMEALAKNSEAVPTGS